MNETVAGRRPCQTGWIRGGLALISLGALSVGVRALFLPASFFEDFPFSGQDWVSILGPYNDHLVRDFGALNLAFGVPHFDLTHTRAFSLGDDLAILIILGLLVVLPVEILIPAYMAVTVWRRDDD